MGTILTAIIETRHRDSPSAGWSISATFELGKDYPLMRFIFDHAEHAWPEDTWARVSTQFQHRDQNRFSAPAKLYIETAFEPWREDEDLSEEPKAQPRTRNYLTLHAMRAAITMLEAELDVRVLTVED